MLNKKTLLSSVAMAAAAATTICQNSADAFSVSQSDNQNRRSFLSKVITAAPAVATASLIVPSSAFAAASTASLVGDLEASKTKMEEIPALLQAAEWDKVRTILKTPPVNTLWNLGESKNPLVLLAKETGEFELLELKDELAISLQICDQLTYDNAFVYFQPGNGKVNIKEPTALANKAMGQIGEAIKLASN